MTRTIHKTASMSRKILSKEQDYIHPLFVESQFEGNIDYDKVFHAPAVLATRLLDTPQALHWAYAFVYGRNTFTAMPAGVKPDGCFKPPGGIDSVPMQYACNKGIDQLSAEEIAAFQRQLVELADRVRFKVTKVRKKAVSGETEANEKPSDSDVHGYDSTIFVSREIYRRALLWTSTNQEDTATMIFDIAIILLHEVAHALGNSLMGGHVEDFFEESLVPESGWEFESRLFGMCPHINHGNPIESYWYTWQTHDSLAKGGHDLDEICRHVWKLPRRESKYPFDQGFAVKLVSDKFWDDDYVKHGALALVPQVIQQLCRSEKKNNTTRAIPQSIRDLFRSDATDARSYAEKKYSRPANPDRVVRFPPVAPEWWTRLKDKDDSEEEEDWEEEDWEEEDGEEEDGEEDEEEEDMQEGHTQEGHAQEDNVQEADLTDAWSEGEGEEADEYVYKRLADLEDEPLFGCPGERFIKLDGGCDFCDGICHPCMIDMYSDTLRPVSGLVTADEEVETTDSDI
jgi:hypothetical protein